MRDDAADHQCGADGRADYRMVIIRIAIDTISAAENQIVSAVFTQGVFNAITTATNADKISILTMSQEALDFDVVQVGHGEALLLMCQARRNCYTRTPISLRMRRYKLIRGSVDPFFHRVNVDGAIPARRHTSAIVRFFLLAMLSISMGVRIFVMAAVYVQFRTAVKGNFTRGQMALSVQGCTYE